MEGRTHFPGIKYVSIAQATNKHPRNDSASIAQLDDGSLFMVWIEMHASEKGGNDEAPASITSMRSHDGGRTWKDYRVEVSPGEGDLSVYNPSLIVLPDGELLFFYLKYHELVWNDPLVSSGYICRSKDSGKNWSEPTTLWSREGYGCANHTFTLLSSGRLLKSAEHVPIWGSYPKCVSSSGCFISDNKGITWEKSDTWVKLPLRGTMENHIVETNAGDLLMVVRNQLGNAYFSRSTDEGVSWSLLQSSGLSASESMPCLTRIPTTGDLLFVWNNAEYDPSYDHSGKRTPLTWAISRDSGQTWGKRQNIEDDPEVEFSNVACSYINDSYALVTYFTSKMKSSAHPGKFGRAAMSLKGAIVSLDRLYA
jgi:sialidase-1